MEYVSDLEVIDKMFVRPLREADDPIIKREELETFIDHAFHNYQSLIDIHTSLLEDLQARQLQQHPQFGMISDIMLNGALQWDGAYMEYMPNYPICKATIRNEMAVNSRFRKFMEEQLRDPICRRQDVDHYIYRPIPRLLRYPLLLKQILELQITVGPPDHPDISAIPEILDLIDKQAKVGQMGVAQNEVKVQLWQLQESIEPGKFGPRVLRDLDLKNDMRELVHRGTVYRQAEGTIGSGAWSELHLVLFNNYLVALKQSKAKTKDAPVRYTISRRPIPLELIKIGNFSDPPQPRSLGMLKSFRGDDSRTAQKDAAVFPFTVGSASGQYQLWTYGESDRKTWQEQLTYAKVLRQEVNDAGKVFDMTTLSVDTFYQPPGYGVSTAGDETYTGEVTCSTPFTTIDQRSLIAVGCENGVWIGVRHDPHSLRKVLHVRNVTQVAVLEEFGIFLVLADKSLLAYHLEALVPTAASPQVRSAPQRLSGMRDIVFFCVGQISGRTLVIYMKRKGVSIMTTGNDE
jgi:hypothetical protein